MAKAQYIWEKFNIPCFADDTGLEVEALNVRRRYIPPDMREEKQIVLKITSTKLLNELDGWQTEKPVSVRLSR